MYLILPYIVVLIYLFKKMQETEPSDKRQNVYHKYLVTDCVYKLGACLFLLYGYWLTLDPENKCEIFKSTGYFEMEILLLWYLP